MIVSKLYFWLTVSGGPPPAVTSRDPPGPVSAAAISARRDPGVAVVQGRHAGLPDDHAVLSDDEGLFRTAQAITPAPPASKNSVAVKRKPDTERPRKRKDRAPSSPKTISKRPVATKHGREKKPKKETTLTDSGLDRVHKASSMSTSVRKPKLESKPNTKGTPAPVRDEAAIQFTNVDKKNALVSVADKPQVELPLPTGTYLDSCAACTVSAISTNLRSLNCTCCLIDGHNCAWNASLAYEPEKCLDVDNDAGVLRCHDGLPAGSFANSCKGCVGNSSYVACKCCFKDTGACEPTGPLIVPPDCGDVDNRKGKLVCANKTLPDGPYQKSCRRCNYNGADSTLKCHCCLVGVAGSRKKQKCVSTAPLKIVSGCNDVFNNKGQLMCRGSLPPGGYLEACTDCSISTVQNHVKLKPVEGIPEQYRDTNEISKLTCGCCNYGKMRLGCRPSVSLLIQKQWCKQVNLHFGFLRCSEKTDKDTVYPGSYKDSCIECNTTQFVDINATPIARRVRMSCFCLDASNTYQPASTVTLGHGCDLVENVRGKLTCHPAPSRYHNLYQFRRSTEGEKLNSKFRQLISQLNAGELASKDLIEGEESWQAFLTKTRQMPVGLFSGRNANTRGIVLLGGGTTYFVSAWVNILMIRQHNCTLPIELFVDDVPEEVLPLKVVKELEGSLGVRVRVLDMLPKQDPSLGFTHSKKFVLKPAAIIFSAFQHVIFLDADNVPLVNLETLFQLPEYKNTGSLFWPDFPALKAAAGIWDELPVSPFMGPQAESGQMVIDKARHWEPLMLSFYFNVHADWYYPKISFGDKDTFQTAWYVLQHHFTMVHWPVASAGYGQGCSYSNDRDQLPNLFRGHTMVHRLPNGKPLFLHKNLNKWTSTLSLADLPGSLPAFNDKASWKQRAWQTVATCELNAGLSIERWFERTNTISSQLCNNLWFFERMSKTVSLDVSLLMRYQCAPTVKSVRVQEHDFLEFVGFDVESQLLSAFKQVLSHPGYKEFVGSVRDVRGHHHSFCKRCKLEKVECDSCGPGQYLWEYKCHCKSPLHTQVEEDISLYEQGAEFCSGGLIRYINHTLVCEREPLQTWSGHVRFARR